MVEVDDEIRSLINVSNSGEYHIDQYAIRNTETSSLAVSSLPSSHVPWCIASRCLSAKIRSEV